MMMFTLGNVAVSLVTQLIDNLKNFITSFSITKSGTTFEGESCLNNDLTKLDSYDLLQSASLIVTPNNYSEMRVIPVTPLPTDGVRNIVWRSEGKTTSWNASAVTAVATSSIIDPAGGQNVVRITETANIAGHSFNQGIPNYITQNSAPYALSAYLKKGDGAAAPDIMQLSYGSAYANFNINTGTVASSGSVFGSSIEDAGDGWYRCIMSGSTTSLGGVNNQIVYVSFNSTGANTVRPSYLGATNRNAFVYGVQFEQSITASAYQRNDIDPQTNNNFASFTNSTFLPYWTNSSGSLQNTPYENLIYPSVGISSINTGGAWRWLRNGLADTITGIQAPDGTLTASRINLGAGTTRPDYYLSYQTSGQGAANPSFTLPKIRTLIAFVKQDSTDRYLGIRLATGNNTGAYDTNSATIKIDCSDGTLANSPTDYTISYSSQSVGNGWYKVCINGTDAWNSFLFQSSATLNTINNTANAGVLIWGVQVIDGTVDINTPVYNREIGYSISRLDYSGSSCPDYLVEASNFNTLLYSEDFTQANWVKINAIATTSSFLAPNNNSYANILTATGSNAIIRQSGTAASTQRQRIFSIYLQRKTGSGPITLSMGSVTGSATVVTGSWTRSFVLDPTLTGTYSASAGNYTVTTSTNHGYSTGDAILFDATTGVGVDASISSVTVTGNTTFTFTNGSATGNGNCTVYSNTGKILIDTLGDEVYAWGAQIESALGFAPASGRLPSSYIPTTTAQVSRGSDTLITDVSGSVSCSMFFELSKRGGSNNVNANYLVIGNEITHALSTDSIAFAGTSNSNIAYSKKENNGSVSTISSALPYAPPDNTTFKTLFTISGSSLNLWIDGTLINTTTFSNPNNLRYITLSGAGSADVRLSQISTWPTTLTRANIDALFSYPYYNAGYTPVNYELQDVINRAYAEGFTIPSTIILGHCDTLLTEMKNDGIWNVADLFLNFAFNDINLTNFSRINWRNANSKLIGVSSLFGGLTYQTNGFKGNGTTGYIDTLVNPSPSVNLPYNYTLNNAGRMLVISEDVTGGNTIYEGNTGTSTRMLALASSLSAFTSNTVNSAAATIDTRGVGLKSIMRDSSTNIRIQNGATTLSTTQTSTAITNNTQMLLRAGSSYSNACVSNYYFGASLTNSQVSNFRTYYNTFLTNIGLTAFA